MTQYDEKTKQVLIDTCDALYLSPDVSYYVKQIARIARTELTRERCEAYIESHQPSAGEDA